jgi:protease IV
VAHAFLSAAGLKVLNIKKNHRSRVLVIEFTGSITEVRVETLLYSLRDMNLPRKSICAVLLRLNSSGGSLGAAQSFCEGLDYLKRELSVPVICLVSEQALSAAFYVAQAADQLIATRSALLGSVGAVQQYFSIANLANRFNVDIRTFSSGLHKSASHPTHNITADQEKAIQDTLDETANHFIDWIARRRPSANLQPTSFDLLSSTITGERCFNMKLVDKIGGLFEALNISGSYSNVKFPEILRVNCNQQPRLSPLLERIVQFAIARIVPSK